MSNIELLALVKAMQAGGGGTGGTYYGGNGIDITGTIIKTKVDNNTLKFDTNGKMYSTIKDVSYKDLTSKNVLIYQDEEKGTWIETTGDSKADTMIWSKGSITFNLGERTEAIDGYVELYIVNYETLVESEAWIKFTEPSANKYTKMIWDITDDVFTVKFVDSAGTETVAGTHSVATSYVHYACGIRNITIVTLGDITGKLEDVINPLPHDSRLDVAFDKIGYATIGTNEIPLRDLTTMDLQPADGSMLYGYYDGTSTYIYDFYRKDYSMIYAANEDDHTDVEVQIQLSSGTLPSSGITLGVYDLWDTGESAKHEMGTFTGTVAEYLLFQATFDEDNYTYKMKWHVKNKDNEVIWTSEQYESSGPHCLYAQVKAKFGVKDMYATYADGVYKRYRLTKSLDYETADWWRDVAITQSATQYTMQIEYGANWGTIDRNYNLTNGFVEFVPNNDPGSTEALPLGEWVFNICNETGGTIATLDYDETATGHARLTYIEFVRDAYGCHIITTNANSEIIDTHTQEDRDTYSYVKLTWVPKGTMPENLPQLESEYSVRAMYEKRYTNDLATPDTYGMVKYDNDTIKVNSQGQLILGLDVIQATDPY